MILEPLLCSEEVPLSAGREEKDEVELRPRFRVSVKSSENSGEFQKNCDAGTIRVGAKGQS